MTVSRTLQALLVYIPKAKDAMAVDVSESFIAPYDQGMLM